jgi:hypothetical protein
MRRLMMGNSRFSHSRAQARKGYPMSMSSHEMVTHDPTRMLASAIELVKAAGYRVSKPRATKTTAPNGLNAIGRPYSEHFDPAYRMKYKTSRRVACAGSSTAAGSNARAVYRAAMERKHAGNPAVFADVCARQGV